MNQIGIKNKFCSGVVFLCYKISPEQIASLTYFLKFSVNALGSKASEMLCSATVGWRTLQQKVQGEVLFSPAGSEFASGKSAIEENRQIKA